jgi:hypothetical protein
VPLSVLSLYLSSLFVASRGFPILQRKSVGIKPILTHKAVQWIPIDFDFVRLDPDPGEKQGPTKQEKKNKFHVFKCWMFSFEGLKASPVVKTPIIEAWG